MKLNMSLFKKLLVANILYSLPVVAMVYLIAESQNTNIDFGKQELKGNVYQRPLASLLKNLGALRMANNDGVALDVGFSQIDADLEKIAQVQNLVGEDLQFTKEGLEKRGRAAIFYPTLKSRWQDFTKQSRRLSSSDRGEKIAQFIADTRMMITHSGDTSNLILDPDLDSYYLMDITLCAMPQLQDRLQDTLAFIQRLRKSGSWTESDRRALGVYAALLKQSDLDRINGDTQTVFQEDPHFYGTSETLKRNLEPAVSDLAKKMDSLIALLTAMSLAPSIEEHYGQTMEAGQSAFNQSFGTWTVAVTELDALIENRVSVLSVSKYRSLTIAILSLLAAFGVLFWVAQSFNTNMRQILARLQAALGLTQDASRKLVAMSDELAAATTEQAAALQETSSAIHEITSMVQATLSNTSVAEASANESLETSTRSHEAVDQLVNAINDISQSNDMIISTVEKSDKRMGDITRIISEIETKTKVINDIVFQTKLLSFNASVEAARAGEHGKGFAVVAEEVGNLAQMSGNASKDISEMLGGQIQQVNTISSQTSREVKDLVSTGKDKVNAGIRVAGQFSSSVEETLTKIRSLRENVTSIHGAAGEQARGIDEISKAVQRLDALTQRNSAMSTETAEYSKDLLTQSETLESIVQTIESEVLGSSKKAA